MICNKCGAQLNDGAKFCKSCGAKMEAQTVSSTPQPQYSVSQPQYSAPQTQSTPQKPTPKYNNTAITAIFLIIVAALLMFVTENIKVSGVYDGKKDSETLKLMDEFEDIDQYEGISELDFLQNAKGCVIAGFIAGGAGAVLMLLVVLGTNKQPAVGYAAAAAMGIFVVCMLVAVYAILGPEAKDMYSSLGISNYEYGFSFIGWVAVVCGALGAFCAYAVGKALNDQNG